MLHNVPTYQAYLIRTFDCETELFSMNQVYRIMFKAVHPNQCAIKYGVEKNN